MPGAPMHECQLLTWIAAGTAAATISKKARTAEIDTDAADSETATLVSGGMVADAITADTAAAASVTISGCKTTARQEIEVELRRTL